MGNPLKNPRRPGQKKVWRAFLKHSWRKIEMGQAAAPGAAARRIADLDHGIKLLEWFSHGRGSGDPLLGSSRLKKQRPPAPSFIARFDSISSPSRAFPPRIVDESQLVRWDWLLSIF